MIRFPSLFVAIAVCGLSEAVSADEIRLADGRVLIGAATVDGEVVRIRTRDGQNLSVPASEVLRIRTDAELRAELRELAESHGGAPHADLEIARLAHRYGLEREMWAQIDACVEAEIDGALEDRLDRFLAGLGPELVPEHLLRADAERQVRSLLSKARGTTSPGRLAAIEAVLAGLQHDDADEQLRIRARGASSAIQRETALRALLRRNAKNEPFVWRTAIVDSSDKVRERSMAIAAETGRADEVVDYLAPGLMQPDGRIRIRTAEAFSRLGSPAAVPALVAAGPSAGSATLSPGATRAHVAFINQQAYVRDFNVEVAMASFIADPVVGVLQSGVVLDATVVSVVNTRIQVVRAYRTALKNITGDDPGPDPDTWASWMRERPELAAVAKKAAAEADALIAKGGGKVGVPGVPGPAGPAAGGGGGGGGNAGNPDGGIRMGPYLPGELPPLPGTAFPPGPPAPRPAPQPPARAIPLPGGRR